MSRDSADTVRGLWELIEGRRWDEAKQLLAEDAVVYWPHTGEVIRGSGNYIELNKNYPEGWHIEILELLAHGSSAAIEVRVPHETLGISFVTGFYRVSGGQIQRGTEYWVDENSQQAPAWRSRFTERR